MYYTLKDHQGSLAAVIHGSTVERLSYDPWGRRRNTTDFGYDNVSHTFDRGYTLHEHYDGFDLINMNGRLYDPILGRMLSPDVVIQDEQSSQAYNRYSYCFNNPLRFTDPSGYVVRGSRNYFDWNSMVYYDFGNYRSNGSAFNTELSEGKFSPIYDVNGYFLGTDDEGIQGDAIVMRREDFKQGMSHEDALALATDLDANNKDAEIRLYSHYSQLRNRPDWDGYLTKSEADDWWLHGNGEPLFVDTERIDLHGITSGFFHNKVGLTKTKNFIWHLPLTETGKTYGTLTLTLLNGNTGEIRIGPKGHDYIDKYDFSFDGRFFRDVATWLGKPKGNGIDFLIYGYGHPIVPIKY